MAKVLILLMSIVLSPLAFAMPELVDSVWLESRLGEQDLVILDIQEPSNFQRFRLPGSVNAPYERWRTDGKPGPAGMLPAIGELEKLLGSLGISNRSRVVIVPTGLSAGEMAAASRVFWTFKVLGHGQVAIMNGGLASYAQRYGIERLRPDRVSVKPVEYRAKPDSRLLLTADQVQVALSAKRGFVDARTGAEFVGLHVGGEKERPGTIPGSKNLPYDWLTDNGSGELHPVVAQEKLFDVLGIARSGEQIHFCHTGSRAALSWFVAYSLLGNREAKLYDGSMAEWAASSGLPMERKIEL